MHQEHQLLKAINNSRTLLRLFTSVTAVTNRPNGEAMRTAAITVSAETVGMHVKQQRLIYKQNTETTRAVSTVQQNATVSLRATVNLGCSNLSN